MLLLCFQPDHEEFKHPEFNTELIGEVEFRKSRLSQLFNDLRMGEASRAKARPVCRSLFSDMAGDFPVVMLKMGHFSEDNERINWDVVRDDLEQQENLDEVDYIDRVALLDAEDLLLNMRGQARLLRISGQMLDEMPEDLARRGLRFAATNNFVLMRPNPTVLYGPYFVIIMEMLLEDFTKEWQNILSERPSEGLMHQYFQWKYSGRSSSPKSTGLPIGVRELKDLSVDIPADPWTQRQLVHRYNVLLFNERMAKEKSQEYRAYLNKFTNPTIIP